MPRDGSGIYSQPFPAVVEGTTIESAVYNGYTADVSIDLNTPRPVLSGGTGASSADQALFNLAAEKAAQVVTNYDSHLWVPGSFRSAAGATGAPNAHAFSGTVTIGEALANPPTNQNVVVEARDLGDTALPGRKYVREKKAGVWGEWEIDGKTTIGAAEGISGETADMFFGVTGTTPDSSFIVNDKADVSGTTLFEVRKSTKDSIAYGNLFVKANAPLLGLDKTTMPSSAAIGGYNNGVQRWQVELGNGATEGGSQTGSNFIISRYSNAGDYLSSPFTINRDDGSVIMNSNVVSNIGGTSGAYFFKDGGQYLQWSTNFNLVGGRLAIVGNGLSTGNTHFAPTSVDNAGVIVSGDYGGGITFQDSGRASIWCQTNDLYLGTGSPSVAKLILVNSGSHSMTGSIAVTGNVSATGYATRSGVSGSYGGNYFNIFHGTGQQLYVDNTNVGTITVTSDYRVKKDVIDLPGMWDTVKALRPIKYTQAEFQPPSQKKFIAEEAIKARKEAEDNPEAELREINTAPLYAADDIERWGFIAHELQEALTSSAATGEKDSPDTIQSPNPFTVIAALTKALQEAMTRIEALEAR